MKARSLAIAVIGTALLAGLTACQTGVTMWSTCSPAADGNPTGTDGEYVLVCKDGTWEPLMTVEEYVALAQGRDVTIAPLPTRPTATPTSTTTPAASTVDQAYVPTDLRDLGDLCPFEPQFTRAQTFTAGRTGDLDQVSLTGSTTGVPPPIVTVEIQTVDGAGYPTGTVLGSGTFTEQFNGFLDWTELRLDTPAPVVADTQYALVYRIPADCLGQLIVANTTTGTYDGGRLVSRQGDGPWVEFGGQADLQFRTWVR